jgi:sugar lactone lactonase YvrE
MHAHEVIAVGLDGESETICEVPEQPSGLGWLPDGTLLVVSMRDRKLLKLGARGLEVVAELEALAPFHCNDMVVDARGNAYVGNFGFDLHGKQAPARTGLILVPVDGAPRIVADELSFPNGCVITPDGGTLIVGETFAACLTAFDIAADASLSNRREWARIEGAVPDGICLDAEGAIWIASPVSREVVRLREGGEVTHRIAVENQAFACMLGGPDGKQLFICTAIDSDPEQCRATRSGRIEVVDVDVPHAGLP